MSSKRAAALTFAILLVVACVALTGCSSHQPPQARVTQIDVMDRAAKPADCSMPILDVEPARGYRKIAIVEAWGKPGHEDEVLEAVRERACETGADALLIVSKASQIDARLNTNGLPLSPEQKEAAADLSPQHDYKEALVPKVGQGGHPGYYIDAFAVVYQEQKTRRHQ